MTVTIEQALAIGFGAPIATGLLSGLIARKEDAKAYWRIFGVGVLSTFAATMIATSFLPSAGAPMAPAPPVRMSVSNVGVQLGRYAGGINYPGQMRAFGGTANGNLVYLD